MVEEPEVDVPFAIIEDVPLFPGCENVPKDKRKDCFQEKIQAHIKKNFTYPDAAIDAGHQGKVFVSFIIEKDGSVNSVSFLKGIGFGCDEEVERIVKIMPKWKAGVKDGKAVRTSFVLPVMFALDNTKKSK